MIDIKNKKVSVKIAGVRLFPEGFKFGPHKHKDVEVIIVEKGICIIHLKAEDQYIHIHKSEGLIIYPNVTHTFIIDESQSCRISQIQFEIEDSNESFLDSLAFMQNLKSGVQYESFSWPAEISSCIGRINKNITDQKLVNLYCIELMMLLSKGIEDYTYNKNINLKNDKLNGVLEYINNNIYEKLIIEDICKMYKVSARYLRKKFQEVTGENISNYITNVRIDHAKELLILSDLSITQISFQMGFSSTQYFNRVFKKRTGLTPSQYRIQHYRDNENLE